MRLLNETIQHIEKPDETTYQAALERLRNQAKPAGSLGLLEVLSARLASIFKTLDVRLDKKMIITCAGDHGICEEGVSRFPSEVTPQMVLNFVNGGASINVLASHANAVVKVADLGVNYDFSPDLPIYHKKIGYGTANFAKMPAMTYEQAIQSIEAGIDIMNDIQSKTPIQLLGTGDMGIGNTTPSTAIIAVYSNKSVVDITGRGTGIDDEGLKRKIQAIEKGLNRHQPNPKDPIDVLSKVGGFEIGGLAGLVLGAAFHKIPVICDGIISTAGALLACEICQTAKEYLFASHRSVEQGHAMMLSHLNLTALFDLQMRLGEGTGAAIAMNILDASTRVLADIKTFEEVGIVDAQK